MSGEAVITIRDKQWQVSLASAPWELAQGLGSIPEIPTGIGMLFDMGEPQIITVTTQPMLFPLDIAFLSDSMLVTKLYRNIEPNYLVTSNLPARYFLEVNAGELEGIEPGDTVTIELLPLVSTSAEVPSWLPPTLSFAGFTIMAAFMANIGRSFTKAIFAKREEPPVPSGSRTERPVLQTMRKHYHGAYLTNWQYGGYSYVEEDPNKPEELWVHGMADYVNPNEVIALAEKEALPHISLAGGFWKEIGYKGWGEKVNIAEAKRALAKARQHVFNKEHKPRAEYIWLRLGDVAEYEKFDSPYEAGKTVGDRLSVHSTDQEALSYRYRAAGVAIVPYFVGNNYISLYWGDENAQWVTDLTSKERRAFERGVEEESGFKRRSELPTRYDVSVNSFVERDRLGIWIVDNRTDKTIAEWWDDDARQMFEDGFFKPATFTRSGELGGAAFIDSVLDYAEEMGWLTKEKSESTSEATW